MEKQNKSIGNLVIIGIHETAEHLSAFVEEYNLFNIVGYAVNAKYKDKETFLGKPVFEIEKLSNVIDKENDFLFVSLLWNHLNGDRRRLYESLKNEGYKFANLISPKASVKGVIKGDNNWINDYVITGAYSEIGSDCYMMSFSMLGHHSRLESHCFVGAKSLIGGCCVVGEQSFIGLNATIFGSLKIGRKCIIGACTGVKRDMPDYSSWKTGSDYVVKTYDEHIIEEKLVSSKLIH